MPSPGVVIDACVLIKAALRDTLLRAYDADLYRLHWSDDILAEVIRNLIANSMTTEAGASRLDQVFRTALADAEITDYADLIASMTNHPKVRHVVAAAVAAGAQIIVTENLRDFPDQALAPYGIQAQSPDEFLVNLFNDSPGAIAQVIREQSEATRRPHLPVTTILAHLERGGAAQFVALLRRELS